MAHILLASLHFKIDFWAAARVLNNLNNAQTIPQKRLEQCYNACKNEWWHLEKEKERY